TRAPHLPPAQPSSGDLLVVVQKQLMADRAENPELPQVHFLEAILETCSQHAKAVLDAAPKIDRRGLGEVLRGTGDFSNPVIKIGYLRQHLIVENKVVRILLEGQR